MRFKRATGEKAKREAYCVKVEKAFNGKFWCKRGIRSYLNDDRFPNRTYIDWKDGKIYSSGTDEETNSAREIIESECGTF